MNVVFNGQCIRALNRLRAKHGCPSIKLDHDLAHAAQKYARTLTLSGELQDCPNVPWGQVLLESSSQKPNVFTGEQAIAEWYMEGEDYDYNKHSDEYQNFTQLIWKSTTSAGFGLDFTNHGKFVIVVGFFDPPGNDPQGYWYNVLPPYRLP